VAKQPKLLPSGVPDGRGQSEGSKANQFRDGGRPGPGRPKGSKNLATLYRELGAMPVKMTINEQEQWISTTEGVLRKQRQKALNGDQRAAERFLDKIAEYSPPEERPPRIPALLAEDAEVLARARGRGLLGVNNPPERPEEEEA
jgi:hypothetical protein